MDRQGRQERGPRPDQPVHRRAALYGGQGVAHRMDLWTPEEEARDFGQVLPLDSCLPGREPAERVQWRRIQLAARGEPQDLSPPGPDSPPCNPSPGPAE